MTCNFKKFWEGLSLLFFIKSADALHNLQKMDELGENLDEVRRSIDEIDDEFALYNKNLNPNMLKMTFPSFEYSSTDNSHSQSFNPRMRVKKNNNNLNVQNNYENKASETESEEVSKSGNSFYVGPLSDTADSTEAESSLEWDSPASANVSELLFHVLAEKVNCFFMFFSFQILSSWR